MKKKSDIPWTNVSAHLLITSEGTANKGLTPTFMGDYLFTMIVGVMPICSALLTLRMALWVTSAHHSSDPGSSTEK